MNTNDTKTPDLIIADDIETSKPTNDFEPKLRGRSYLEICVEDAMYNPTYEVCMQYNKGSEFAGMGLTRPDHFLTSYQRLWEYYVNMEVLRDAVYYDYMTTGVVPNFNPLISGVGFNEEVLH